MHIRFAFILAVVLCFWLTAGVAAANTATQKVQDKYKEITAMRADFTQILVHKESGSRETRNGVIHFKKPLLVRWETKKPSPELLLVTGDAIWDVFPDEEIAYKYTLDLAKDSRSIVSVVTGQASLDNDFFVEDKGMDQGMTSLHLYPKEPTQAMVEARLWIDPKTDLIKKIRVYDFYGNENEMTFTRQDVNPKIQNSLFTYTPPKGFEIEDRTKNAAGAPRNF